jgi:polyhydroxyalkanoate synthase
MAPPDPTALLARVNRDVERSLLRARNGIRYVRGTHRPALGVTPKDVVWKRDKAQLWHYRNREVRTREPIVIITSLVSRSYILDLLPGSSSVQFLRDAGFDVYMLDWGIPDELDATNTFETYVDEYVPRAIEVVLQRSGAAEVTLVGYCLGGVIAVLYACGHQAPVRNIVLLATPVDFDEMGPMVAALQEGRLDPEELLDDTGNVSADVLYSGFFMMAPTTVVAQNATLLENLWNDEFVRGFQAVNQWTRDQVPFPGAAFRQVVEDLVRRNVLMSGSWELGGRAIDLEATDAIVLNVMAANDRVVPRAASAPASRLVGRPGRREELVLKGGHATFGTGRSAFKNTLPRLAEWIAANSSELPEGGERHGHRQAQTDLGADTEQQTDGRRETHGDQTLTSP